MVKFRLSWIDPISQRQRQQILDTPVSLGKSLAAMPMTIANEPISHMVVGDLEVADFHVLLLAIAGELYIVNNAGMTYVNQQLVQQQQQLKTGDRIYIGQTELELQIEAPPAQPPATAKTLNGFQVEQSQQNPYIAISPLNHSPQLHGSPQSPPNSTAQIIGTVHPGFGFQPSKPGTETSEPSIQHHQTPLQNAPDSQQAPTSSEQTLKPAQINPAQNGFPPKDFSSSPKIPHNPQPPEQNPTQNPEPGRAPEQNLAQGNAVNSSARTGPPNSLANHPLGNNPEPLTSEQPLTPEPPQSATPSNKAVSSDGASRIANAPKPASSSAEVVKAKPLQQEGLGAGCRRSIGFLIKRQCGRMNNVGCEHCADGYSPQAYRKDYALYEGFGRYAPGDWGYEILVEAGVIESPES